MNFHVEQTLDARIFVCEISVELFVVNLNNNINKRKVENVFGINVNIVFKSVF